MKEQTKKTTNPAALDKLRDLCGRVDAVYAMLDVLHEECQTDRRIYDAVFGVVSLAKSISDDLYAFRADYEKEATA